MAVKRISIDQLVPGMYLVGVDIPWIDTPFLRNKFLVKNTSVVAKLRSCGAAQVDIDTERGADVAPPPVAAHDAPTLTGETVPAVAEAAAASSEGGAVENAPATASPAPSPVPPAAEEPIQAPAPSPKPAPRPARAATVPTAPAGYEEEMDRAKKIKGAGEKIMRKAFETVRTGGKIEESMFGALIEHTVGSTKRNSLAMLTMLHQQPNSQELIHHAFNQMSMAVLLGQKMGVEGDRMENLATAALLMDVGWIRLPRELMRQGHAYTDDEFNQVREHVKHSIDILDAGGFHDEVLQLVEHHHERADGTGYPEALAGDEIPVEAQILSLVNHFESNVHGLYDAAPVIPVTALRNIYTSGSEGGHDSQLTKQLISVVGIYPMSSAVELDSGERGVVVKVNWKQPMKPLVRVIYGKDRQPLLEPHDVDLAVENKSRAATKVAGVLDPRNTAVDPRGLLIFAEA